MDFVTMVCRELRAEGKLEYDARREREMRLLKMLYDGGWRTGTDARIAWVRGLSEIQLNGISTSIVIGKANDQIEKTEDTLIEKLGYTMHGHTLDGAESGPGTIHPVLDGERPFGHGVFNERFWRKSPGEDLTLRDDLGILPPEHRKAIHFGQPIEKRPET